MRVVDTPDSNAPDLTAENAEPAAASPAAQAGPRDPKPSPAAPLRAPPAKLAIAVKRGVASTSQSVDAAYRAYAAGDYGSAKVLYREVLNRDPDQIDALLGAGALALHDGELAPAHRHYKRVLKLDPDNPTATAALLSIEGGQGDGATESRLKTLLDAGIDRGYVFFSLGNLYARHQRWADAQQAYFEALRARPSSADYNFNLAVSLDRIGQRDAALKYYDAAVSLADRGRAGFDVASALARIQSIRNAQTPPHGTGP